MIGVQNASAQYVNADTASDLLTAEIAATNASEAKDANNPNYQAKKVELYSFVLDQIEGGSTVTTAILGGANRYNYTVSSFSGGATIGKNPYVAPLHQELMDLLAL